MKKPDNEPKPDNQTEKCLRELRSRIISGQWPGATKLREVPLATDLDVSRTPLRAALLKLEQEGLLERSGAGYTVRAFSFKDALVAIELRGMIEGMAVRLAAERLNIGDHLTAIKATVAALDTVVQQEHTDGYGDLNKLFHDQLTALAGNDLIRDEVQRASRLPFAAPSAFSSSKDDYERFKESLVVGQQHHHALLQAIERGEGARAEALAREHAHLAKINIEVAFKVRAEKLHHMPQLALITD